MRHDRIQNKILCAATDYYYYYYDLHLEKLGKAPERVARGPFLFVDKKILITRVTGSHF